jgi:hypothetical protein
MITIIWNQKIIILDKNLLKMTPLFKKLNFKNHSPILVLNAPETFEKELKEMKNETSIITAHENLMNTEFAIIFATKQTEIDQSINAVHSKLEGDAVLWFCYPKGTSKKYKCDFNRDTGWKSVAQHNLEPVRMVAIDEDWSALRFRKVAYIKTITRRESFALTDEAKKRTSQKGK